MDTVFKTTIKFQCGRYCPLRKAQDISRGQQQREWDEGIKKHPVEAERRKSGEKYGERDSVLPYIVQCRITVGYYSNLPPQYSLLPPDAL